MRPSRLACHRNRDSTCSFDAGRLIIDRHVSARSSVELSGSFRSHAPRRSQCLTMSALDGVFVIKAAGLCFPSMHTSERWCNLIRPESSCHDESHVSRSSSLREAPFECTFGFRLSFQSAQYDCTSHTKARTANQDSASAERSPVLLWSVAEDLSKCGPRVTAIPVVTSPAQSESAKTSS